MCGFIGYSHQINKKNTFHETKFNFYHNHMINRGPDFQIKSEIENSSKKFHLGFSRLAIQDTSEKANKIFKNKRYALLYNGEIYNSNYLKKQYLKDQSFETDTDTEILFNFLLLYGISKLDQLEGIFSFVFFDLEKNKIYLTRDYTGTKPLFYSIINGEIFFSSEAWFLYSINEKKIDYNSLNHYLRFGFPPIDQTLVKNVFKVKPNSTLIFNLNNQTKEEVKIYENLGFSNKEKELCEIYPDTLNIKIRKTIEKNLIGNKRIGTFLSGGIDSTIISTEIKKINPNIEAYTSIYKGYENKDEDFLITKKVCKEKNIKLNVAEIDLKNKYHHEDFFKACNYFDEPISNLNFYSSYCQSKLAKKNGLNIILTGDGADEIFGGYRKYLTYNIFQKFSYLSFFFNKFKNYKKIRKENLSYFFLKKFEINNVYNLFNTDIKIKLQSSNSHLFLNENTKTNLSNINFFDFNNWLNSEHNAKLDKFTMANSIESRVPFQDFDLIKHLNVNSIGKKIFLFKNKLPLRKAYKSEPKYVFQRKKQGWFLPEKVILNDLFENKFNILTDQDQDSLIDIKSFIENFESKKYEFLSKYQIITLLILQIWYKNILKC